MPNPTNNNTHANASANNQIQLTESEKYHLDRENFFNGKRTFELPQDNFYRDFDQQTK